MEYCPIVAGEIRLALVKLSVKRDILISTMSNEGEL